MSDYISDSAHVLGVMNTDDHKSTNNFMALYLTIPFKMTIHIVNRLTFCKKTFSTLLQANLFSNQIIRKPF